MTAGEMERELLRLSELYRATRDEATRAQYRELYARVGGHRRAGQAPARPRPVARRKGHRASPS